jgi:hypothetical protein
MMHDSKCGCPDCYGRNFRNFEGAASAGTAPEVPTAAVIAVADRYAGKWADKDDAYWMARLTQEVGELASSLVGDHADPPEHELRQIGSIAINWLRRRAQLPKAQPEAKERDHHYAEALLAPRTPPLASPLAQEEIERMADQLRHWLGGNQRGHQFINRLRATARAYHDALADRELAVKTLERALAAINSCDGRCYHGKPEISAALERLRSGLPHGDQK